MRINGLLFGAFVLSLFVVQANAQSTSAVTGGTIRFTGAIVEGPCDVSYTGQQATTTCLRGGQNLQQTRNLTKNGLAIQELPANLGTTQVKWLNSQHSLGIMTVSYR